MPSANTILGIGAALTAALIGAGWQLATRHGVTTTLGAVEIAVLRYGVPALVLLPLWRRIGFKPASMSWPQLAIFAASGGLPFGLLVVAGAQFAPAAHIAVFMSGTMPIFTAVAGWLFLKERMTAPRACGLAMVLAGVLWFGASAQVQSGSWRGDVLFLCAALVWSVHTLAYRRSSLGPWEGAAVVNGWSALALLAILPWSGAPRLFTAPLQDVLFQAVWQGGVAGLLGLVAYMAAVSRLGSARASLSAAIVPALTAAGAALLLGEPLGWQAGAAVVVVGLGVALASGAVLAVGVKKVKKGFI